MGTFFEKDDTGKLVFVFFSVPKINGRDAAFKVPFLMLVEPIQTIVDEIIEREIGGAKGRGLHLSIRIERIVHADL